MKWIIGLIALTLSVSAHAQSAEQRQKEFNVKKNLGAEGYDVVSYFDNKPLEGNEKIQTVYKGITYRFANVGNLNKFKSTPDKYEPAYGGWCAFAMGETGEKVKIDPETFKILDGKLYLFYHFWGNNTLESWNKNEKVLKSKADQNWKKLIP